MNDLQLAGRRRLWLRFFGGACYLMIPAVFLTAAAKIDFLFAYLAVLAGTALATVVGLTWLTLWARRKDSRMGQFQIGSLFFLTALLAMLLGAARWTVGRMGTERYPPADTFALLVVVTCVWLFLAAISLPFVMGMAEAVVWAGVWSLRQPVVRRAVRSLRTMRGPRPGTSATIDENPLESEQHVELRGDEP